MSCNKKQNENCRLGTVGGQAVLEGVMMKSKDKVALSVRETGGKIVSEVNEFKTVREKVKFFNIPVIRGIVNFVETMILSFSTLTRSADMLGIEEEESKFEKWLTKTFGKSIATIASVIGGVLGIGLALLLFFYLPALISDFTVGKETDMVFLKSIIEGVVKIVIFVGYVWLCSFIPDMKRTFMYHGAEHKSIFCHESIQELTVENVKKQSRFHPRCGTSFLVVMMILGILVSAGFVNLPRVLRVCSKLITLPLVVGVGFEFIRYAGKHDNFFIRMISAPGLWVQRLTTKEPDDSMIEVAITSLKLALPEIYPEETEKLNCEKNLQSETNENKEETDDL